jgi:hypothetical protein
MFNLGSGNQTNGKRYVRQTGDIQQRSIGSPLQCKAETVFDFVPR